MKTTELIALLKEGKADEKICALYGKENADFQRARYIAAAEAFVELYGDREGTALFSVPGRSEISGNHTDHNHGRVIAAAIDLDIIAVACKTEDGIVRIKSEGRDEDVVEIASIAVDESRFFSSASLIAGECAGFVKYGHQIGGFVAYTTNRVAKGSGLSSSAAFEDMVGNILNHFYNDGVVPSPEIAKISQYSENVYFGKPCGLMDQTACAVGGFVAIDFADPSAPVIEKMDFDLSALGYNLCITNTGGNHADLNEDYASVPAEMKAVAGYFGKEVLRGMKAEEIIAAAPALREKFGDRAILRALHFIDENDRVEKQTEAVRRGDLDAFLAYALASGNSSFKYLQNVYTTKNIAEQGLSLALAVTENVLSGCRAAWRVHGGGFAGTIQAFVPSSDVERYKKTMDQVFGEGACSVLRVRGDGAIRVI